MDHAGEEEEVVGFDDRYPRWIFVVVEEVVRLRRVIVSWIFDSEEGKWVVVLE
jgi:hypothetical protein